MFWRSALSFLSLAVVWAVSASCSSKAEPEFDAAPTLANREEITEAMRAVGAGMETRVVLLVHVDANGRVTEVRVRQSSGDAGLDDAAQWIGQQMRFAPARHEGKEVAAWVTVPVTFDVVAPGGRPPRLRNAQEVAEMIARDHPDLEGVVHLRVKVDAEGVIKVVRDRQATNREVLSAGRSAIRQLQFWPALQGFREVDTWVTVVIEFRGAESRIWVEGAESSD